MKSIIKLITTISTIIFLVLPLSSMQAVYVNAAENDEIPETTSEEATEVEEVQLLPCGGKTFPINSTEIDLSNARIPDISQFIGELEAFENLSKVTLCGSNLSNEQMEVLMQFLPDIKFVWNVVLAGYWTIRTDQIAFSCNKGPGPRVTDADVQIFKYCPDMELLDVGHNNLTNLSFVKYMPKLRCLIVSDGRVSDISDIKYCKDMIRFEAWFCRVSDISAIQYLVNLMDFNVSHNSSCNDITPLLHLPRIESVYMSYCNLSADSAKKLRNAFPNADIELSQYYAYAPNWRRTTRYYDMRNMYTKNKFTLLDSYKTDYDRLSYFSKVFNAEYYKENYPNVVSEIGDEPLDLLYYFLNTGMKEGQQGCDDFNLLNYINEHPELVSKYGDNYDKYLIHYLTS